MTEIAVGDILMRRYRVEKLLGAGGMGMVLAVRHIHLDELFAIKIVRPELIHDDEIVQRFLQEAQSCARLKSPHVARVTDVDRLPGGEPFMVMEHLTGEDLGALLKDKGRLPIPDAVNYVVQACDAIGEAHAIGILHRDLKPANLFLTKDRHGAPMVKVLDFGISKVLDRDDDEELTRTTVAMGTPPYMPPEQFVNARHVTARSDIWSLGCVLYRILTNELPFRKDENRSVEEMVRTIEPAPPRKLRPEIPEALEAVILRCLRKKKDERFPTASALAEALCTAVGLPLPIAGSVPTPQRDPTPPPSPPQPSPPPAEPPLPLTNRGEKSTVPDGGGPAKKQVEPTLKGLAEPTDFEIPVNFESGAYRTEVTTKTPVSTDRVSRIEHTDGASVPQSRKRDLRLWVGGVVGLAASVLGLALLLPDAGYVTGPVPPPIPSAQPDAQGSVGPVVEPPPSVTAATSAPTSTPSASASVRPPPPPPPPPPPRRDAGCNPKVDICL